MSKTTIVQDPKLGELTFTTQQYAVGTYIVIYKGTELLSQTGSTLSEEKIHQGVRKDTEKVGGKVLSSDYPELLKPVEKKVKKAKKTA